MFPLPPLCTQEHCLPLTLTQNSLVLGLTAPSPDQEPRNTSTGILKTFPPPHSGITSSSSGATSSPCRLHLGLLDAPALPVFLLLGHGLPAHLLASAQLRALLHLPRLPGLRSLLMQDENEQTCFFFFPKQKMKEAEVRAARLAASLSIWLPDSRLPCLSDSPARQEGSLPLCRWNPIHPLLRPLICA